MYMYVSCDILYAQVYPCDRPVVIAYVDKDGDEEELVPVERLYIAFL